MDIGELFDKTVAANASAIFLPINPVAPQIKTFFLSISFISFWAVIYNKYHPIRFLDEMVYLFG